MFLPDNFLAAWLPDDFDVDTAAPILAILMVSLLFAQPGHLLAQFLVARGRHSRLAVARLATVAVNLLLSIALAFWVGLWGVAVATLVDRGRLGRLRPAVPAPAGVVGVAARARRRLAAAGRPRRPGCDPDLALPDASSTIDTLVEFTGLGLLWLALFGALVWRFALREPERRTIGDAFGRGSTAVVGVSPTGADIPSD